MWVKQIFLKSVCHTDNKKDKIQGLLYTSNLIATNLQTTTVLHFSMNTDVKKPFFSMGLSYHSPNNFREGCICVHVNKACVLELQLPRQHLLIHFHFILYWAYTYEEGQNPFVHAQFIYIFVLSAGLVKTCQWTFKGSIVIYKITPEGGNKCCLRYWIVGTEPIM